MAFSMIVLLAPSRPASEQALFVSRSPLLSAAFTMLLVGTWITFALQHSPWTLYIYVVFPVYFWYEIACTLWQADGTQQMLRSFNLWHLGATVLLTGGLLQSMVVRAVLIHYAY
jgi:phosphatidylinositol glycan class N